MTTLRQLAEHLGLSPATVSRALNGFPEVGEANHELITLGISMVMYPFVESSLVETLMPSMAMPDESALQRRKRVIVNVLLGGVRPSPTAPSRT